MAYIEKYLEQEMCVKEFRKFLVIRRNLFEVSVFLKLR